MSTGDNVDAKNKLMLSSSDAMPTIHAAVHAIVVGAHTKLAGISVVLAVAVGLNRLKRYRKETRNIQIPQQQPVMVTEISVRLT